MATGFGRFIGAKASDGAGGIVAGTSFDTEVDIPAGERIVVGFAYVTQPNNDPSLSISGPGLAFGPPDAAGSDVVTSNQHWRIYEFSAVAPPGGVPAGTTISGTLSGSSVFAPAIAGMTLTGVATDDWQSGSGEDTMLVADATWQAELTTLGPEGAVVGFAFIDRATTHSPGTGFTQAVALSDATNGSTLAMVYAVNLPEATYDPAGTFGAGAVTRGRAVSAGYAAAPPAISARLSGGTVNADPENSHGGAESSVVLPLDPSDSALFRTVSTTQANNGNTQYRLIYIHNDDAVSCNVAAYIDTQAPGTQQIALAAPTQAAGVVVPATASQSAAPGGVSFSVPTTIGAAIDLGTIPSGSFRGLWVRRTIPSGTGLHASDPWAIALGVTPL